MSNTLHVIYLDGTTEDVVAAARAEVEVERRFDVAFAQAFAPGRVGRHEHLFALAWAALRYGGKTAAELDDWLALVDDVDLIPPEPSTEEAEAERPTRPAPRRAKSSS